MKPEYQRDIQAMQAQATEIADFLAMTAQFNEIFSRPRCCDALI
jgi:hypothetical protein